MTYARVGPTWKLPPHPDAFYALLPATVGFCLRVGCRPPTGHVLFTNNGVGQHDHPFRRPAVEHLGCATHRLAGRNGRRCHYHGVVHAALGVGLATPARGTCNRDSILTVGGGTLVNRALTWPETYTGVESEVGMVEAPAAAGVGGDSVV